MSNGESEYVERREKIFKAFANRKRISILRYLKRHGEKSVSDISNVIDVAIKSTSKHLSILRNANLLEERQGWLLRALQDKREVGEVADSNYQGVLILV